MSRFASGNKALGLCDVCGFTYKLKQLKDVRRKGKNTHVKACPECWDGDHPQLKLGEFPVDDPQALRDPRPDSKELSASRAFQYGWNPVGLSDPFNLIKSNSLLITGKVGVASVIIS